MRSQVGRSGHRAHTRRIEWPTWLVMIGCHAAWAAGLVSVPVYGWPALVPLAIAIALHSSLQHEVLHGHPTRNAALNEATVFLPLGLWIPFRRFRDLHIRHHNNEHLTDPYDDPESFYLYELDWWQAGWALRLLLSINATFLGRVTLGPLLAIAGFWHSEMRLLWRGDLAVRGAWVRHCLGLVGVIALVAAAGVSLWMYAVAAYGGLALIMVRSFIEHRAAHDPDHRTAVVEAGWFWRLLFLNNNFHFVHHEQPSLAWYHLPLLYRQRGEEVGMRNGGYILPGYGAVAWRWLVRAREPVVHPYQRRAATPDEMARLQ